MFNNDVDEPFELFISSQEIRYCYYKETHKILGFFFIIKFLLLKNSIAIFLPKLFIL
jgi:tRNA(Met) C34 N-acetyltransferase TmcA